MRLVMDADMRLRLDKVAYVEITGYDSVKVPLVLKAGEHEIGEFENDGEFLRVLRMIPQFWQVSYWKTPKDAASGKLFLAVARRMNLGAFFFVRTAAFFPAFFVRLDQPLLDRPAPFILTETPFSQSRHCSLAS